MVGGTSVSRLRSVGFGLLATLVLALGLLLPATAHASPAPPGTSSWISSVRWTSEQVAPGVTVRNGVLAQQVTPYWTVTVEDEVTSSFTGQPAPAEVGPPSWADQTVSRLAADGYHAQTYAMPWPSDYTDVPHGLEGIRVRVGDYSTQAQAQTTATALQALGFTVTVEWTGYDADTTMDAEQFHEAIITRRSFRGQLEVTHDGAVAQRQTASAVGAALGAAVATNASFFYINQDSDGYQGVPMGIAAYDGRLESMSEGDRGALVLGQGAPQIEQLQSTVTVSAGRSSTAVQGINRVPGYIESCGRPNSVPSTLPAQDITCTAPDDLVLFTPELDASLPTGTGVQVVLDGSGHVLSVGARGGDVPAGGAVLQGIGTDAAWLSANVHTGQEVQLSERVTDSRGLPVPLSPSLSIASAAPVLLQGGRPAIDAATEGAIKPSDLSFNFSWAEDRQPRTMVGVDAEGDLLLVTADGRDPGVSEGLTLSEEASFMQGLGAVEALNLDGGGSTSFAVNGVQINHPSDATGERPVGDFVVAIPAR